MKNGELVKLNVKKLAFIELLTTHRSSVVSYEEIENAIWFETAMSENVVADVYRSSDSQSQEFRFNYEGNYSKSIIGLYYSQGKAENDTLIEDIDGSAIFSGLLLDYVQNAKDDYTNAAIFFNTDYYLNEELTLIIGARLDRDKRSDDVTLNTLRANDLSALNTIIDAGIANAGLSGENDGTSTTTNFIPKIGLNYKITNDISTGLTYSEGYRPGGRGINPISGISQEYDTESTENFELSFRSQWLKID